MSAESLIAFGSNQGHSIAIYKTVQDLLGRMHGCKVLGVSQLHQTAPVGGPGQPEYSNGAIRITTGLNVDQLHQQLAKIENDLGRERRIRWGPRVVDLDLLLFEQVVISNADLTVPHPRMSFRRFVLEPAAEVAADWVHPTSQMTIGQLLDRLNQPGHDIEWITERPEEIKSRVLPDLKTRFPDWEFLVKLPLEASDRSKSSESKLLVHDTLVDAIGSPSLNLTGCSFEEMKTELAAALEAMA